MSCCGRRGDDRLVDIDPGVLTERELDVLRLIGSGFTNREVGAKLFLSTRTIEFHRVNIRRKLSADSRADLVRCAREFGLA